MAQRARGCGIRLLILVILVLAAIPAYHFLKVGSIFTDGRTPLVVTARGELGNKHGEPYWSWYGFDEEVDWCGCFVSWCAEQNGYIDGEMVPKFCYVQEGLNWYKSKDSFKEASEKPSPGDIIFFDWNTNDVADHVGIVSGTRFGRVFTIEGNTGDDECMRKGYWLSSKYIMGYGMPEG